MGWMSLLAAFMLRFTGASLSVEVRKGRFLLKLSFGRTSGKFGKNVMPPFGRGVLDDD